MSAVTDEFRKRISDAMPEAVVAAAKFPGADPKVVARKLAIAKQLAAEEPIEPEAVVAAAKFPGADPKIVARKLQINEQLRAEEAAACR